MISRYGAASHLFAERADHAQARAKFWPDWKKEMWRWKLLLKPASTSANFGWNGLSGFSDEWLTCSFIVHEFFTGQRISLSVAMKR
ncbi:hypothetical protein Ancab_035890 [Ancistrocladus abbreviatus]